MKMTKSYGNFFIVIPAYNPDEKLIQSIEELYIHIDGSNIIIVNDGSNEELSIRIFKYIHSKYNNIIILNHPINLGKGAALKTAFMYIMMFYPNVEGVVTMDSDGQHLVEDVLKVLHVMQENINNKNYNFLILGYRSFKNIPFRSFIGNTISRYFYYLLTGKKLKDTQTGLRAISKKVMIESLKITYNRYEFETEQLLIAIENKVEIIEIPIQTIYYDNNKRSHFNPLLDSVRIYFVLLRYIFSSIAVAIFDLALFTIILFTSKFDNIYVLNLISRNASIVFQFFLLKNFVFKEKYSVLRFIIFILYVNFMGYISSFMQIKFNEFTNFGIIFSKVIIESILFIINFAFIRNIVLYIEEKEKV